MLSVFKFFTSGSVVAAQGKIAGLVLVLFGLFLVVRRFVKGRAIINEAEHLLREAKHEAAEHIKIAAFNAKALIKTAEAKAVESVRLAKKQAEAVRDRALLESKIRQIEAELAALQGLAHDAFIDEHAASEAVALSTNSLPGISSLDIEGIKRVPYIPTIPTIRPQYKPPEGYVPFAADTTKASEERAAAVIKDQFGDDAPAGALDAARIVALKPAPTDVAIGAVSEALTGFVDALATVTDKQGQPGVNAAGAGVDEANPAKA